MDQNIRPRAPFTLRNKNTAQECEFHDQSEVDTFRSQAQDAGDWELVDAASEPAATPEVEAAAAAPEAPAAAPAVTEAPAPKAPAKPRAKK